jgi:hypothetical protein
LHWPPRPHSPRMYCPHSAVRHEVTACARARACVRVRVVVRASIDGGGAGGGTRAELGKDLFTAVVALVQGAGGPLGVVHVLELDIEIAPEVRPVVPAHLHKRDAAKRSSALCVRRVSCVRCAVVCVVCCVRCVMRYETLN